MYKTAKQINIIKRKYNKTKILRGKSEEKKYTTNKKYNKAQINITKHKYKKRNRYEKTEINIKRNKYKRK